MLTLIFIAAATAGIGTTSWEEGSADYPDESYTPAEVESWSVEADLPESFIFGSWTAEWEGDTLYFAGMEDGSVCLVEDGPQVVSPITSGGPLVGWGWGAAYDGGEEPLAIHSLTVTGPLTGDESFTWTPASGWGDGDGPAPEVPPLGAPWSLAVFSSEGEGVTLSADRLTWEVGPDGLSYLRMDVGGFGFPLGSTTTVTLSWLSE
jgi:hypothetical protein